MLIKVDVVAGGDRCAAFLSKPAATTVFVEGNGDGVCVCVCTWWVLFRLLQGRDSDSKLGLGLGERRLKQLRK